MTKQCNKMESRCENDSRSSRYEVQKAQKHHVTNVCTDSPLFHHSSRNVTPLSYPLSSPGIVTQERKSTSSAKQQQSATTTSVCWRLNGNRPPPDTLLVSPHGPPATFAASLSRDSGGKVMERAATYP